MKLRPIMYGIFAAFFFAFTFVINAIMESEGGSWIWSASLRFIFMVPFLLIIVILRKNLVPLLKEMKRKPIPWILWSFVGFFLFYAPLCYAAAHSPGWLIAGTWQFTIVAGTLLSPLFLLKVQKYNTTLYIREKIPLKALLISLLILSGIFFMQLQHISTFNLNALILGVFPVLIAAFAYPLGNRKMMEACEDRIDTFQRVLGMTLASLPFWFILSIYGLYTEGLPSYNQSFQVLIVAIFSGIIATALFFKATNLVRGNMQKLAAVEATQSLEVLFALSGEIIFLSIAFPSFLSLFGILIVIIGMALHSFTTHTKITKSPKEVING